MSNWMPSLDTISSVSSIIGLIVTILILFEARKIRISFLRRARLPELNRDLAKSASQLSDQLKEWEVDKTSALKTFSTIKALLESIRPKLPSVEKKKLDDYLAKLHPKKCLVLDGNLSGLTEDEAWKRYTELSGLMTTLQQLVKDSKWD
ncbi:hypothetical protein GCM10008090_30910 [Arenicella chitinivorans]|uniref:DUF2489 domain-containing protein n=1 Tax=Arenicella chitinivorans TaxID=1329800 RepID=A0A918VSK2_9GAMM|nr:hypothetical protein [Arenicella chitinivorans]GHA19010.1 hypothetical protein GCM10008090_30910 [Arenicella chitinivorans]